jgi:ABC-type dipeptide/oligopeptide/nickel transport system permease component
MGSLVIGSVMLVAGNLVSDLLLAYVDPRVRYD